MLADDSIRGEILAVLTRLAQAYQAKDAQAALALCVPDESLLMIGTGSDEIRKGSEAVRLGLERDFAQADTMSVSYSDIQVACEGTVAWAYASCQARIRFKGELFESVGRYTTVFRKVEGEWLIGQAHLSLPDSSQAPGDSFPS